MVLFPERGPSPSHIAATKMINLFKSKTNDSDRSVASPVPSKLASLLKPKLTVEQANSITSGNSDNSNDGQTAISLKRDSIDHGEPLKDSNESYSAPSPISKLGAVFNRKLADDSRSKSPTPPNLKLGPTDTRTKSPTPTKILVTKDTTSNALNILRNNQSSKPKKMQSPLGGAASLGQFLEFKMRGGKATV